NGESPKKTDEVTVNYRGSLLNGTEFDSSYKRGQPATFPVNGVIPGWTEALGLMKPGAKWELFVPPQLAYDMQSRPPIPPGSLLIFEVAAEREGGRHAGAAHLVRVSRSGATGNSLAAPEVRPQPSMR